ncbi:hypothetical protein M948_00800 [Virgibacillus sp. CM-4]|uniref:DUF2269 family protein n=1 Tax=Virgibacillus sp. CM-4 TaxID=1354277 RepID=UPI00038884E8|nr:DUF2269 family protein [Virgibacillus sp. CM-4]EQB38915.1 hypothetical protein M948_00800 [Virgibacillus sp. CM-4]
MTFYDLLAFVHIFSAILGLGPGFMMIPVVSKAKTMEELRYAFAIRGRLHRCVMIGGTLLLVTGLIMGSLRPHLFTEGWYVLSLALFLIGLAFGPLVLSPKSKPIKKLLNEYQGKNIPVAYDQLSRKLFFYENIENFLFLLIIVLMFSKPF